MKSQLIAFALTALAGLTSARAAANDCQFISRDDLGAVLSEMPAQVTGWMNCSARAKGVNVFVVAELDSLSEERLAKFVTMFSKKIDITTESAQITWQSKSPLNRRQLIVRTVSSMNSAGEKLAMSHYAFVAERDGKALLYIHSMDEQETNKIKSTLSDLNRRLSPPRS